MWGKDVAPLLSNLSTPREMNRDGLASRRTRLLLHEQPARISARGAAAAKHEAVLKYGRRIGVPHLAPHDLRRTFAKLAHKGGAKLDQIQLSLGHASLYSDDPDPVQEEPCITSRGRISTWKRFGRASPGQEADRSPAEPHLGRVQTT